MAFAELVERHGPAMHRYAARMLNDPSETADCLQDAFVDAWQGLAAFRGESAVRTWLFTLTAHAVRRHQRRHLARTPAPANDEVLRSQSDPTSTSDPARAAEMNQFVVALDAALAHLPSGHREVWLLREVEELSYLEIARITATTTDTVRGRLARARITLENSMQAWR